MNIPSLPTPEERKQVRDQRKEILRQLICLKFGPLRGSISRACETLGIQQSNMSAYLGGASNVPDKVLRALSNMPDYIEPELINRTNTAATFTLALTGPDFELLKDCFIVTTDGPTPVPATNSTVTQFFKFLMNKYINQDDHPIHLKNKKAALNAKTMPTREQAIKDGYLKETELPDGLQHGDKLNAFD